MISPLQEPRWEVSPAGDTDSPRKSVMIMGDIVGFTVAEPQQERLPSLSPKAIPFRFIARSNACSPPEPNLEHGRYIPEERCQAAGESKGRICGERQNSEVRRCNYNNINQLDSALQRYLKDDENDRLERIALQLTIRCGNMYLKEFTHNLEIFNAIKEGRAISITPERHTTDRTSKHKEHVHAGDSRFPESTGSKPLSLTSASTFTDDSTNSVDISQGKGAIPIPPNTTHNQNRNVKSVESSLEDGSSPYEMASLPSIHAPDHEYLGSVVAKLRSESDHHRDDVSLSLEGDSSCEAEVPAIPNHSHHSQHSPPAHLESESGQSCDDESLDSDEDESSSEAESLSTVPSHGHNSHSLRVELQSQQGVVQFAGAEGSTSVGFSGGTLGTNALPSTNTSLSTRSGSQNYITTSNSNNNGHSDDDDDDERFSKPPGGTKSSRILKTPKLKFRCILSVLCPEKYSSCIDKSFERRHLWTHVKRDHVRCEHCGDWLTDMKILSNHPSDFIDNPDAQEKKEHKKTEYEKKEHEKKEVDGVDKIDFIGLKTLRELDAIYKQEPKLSFEELWDKWWKVLSADPLGDPTPTFTINLETSKFPELLKLVMEKFNDGVSNGQFEPISDDQRVGMEEAIEKALRYFGRVVEKKERRKLPARKRTKRDENDTGLMISVKPPTRTFTAGVARNPAGGPNLLGFESEPHNFQQLPPVDMTSTINKTFLTATRTANDFPSQLPSHAPVAEANGTDGMADEMAMGSGQPFQLQQPPSPNSSRVWNDPFQPHPSGFRHGDVEFHQDYNPFQAFLEGPSSDMDPGMDMGMTTQPHHTSASVSTSPCQVHFNSHDPPSSDSFQAVGMHQTLLGASSNSFQMRQPDTEGFSDQRHRQGPATGEGGSSHDLEGLDSGSSHGGGPPSLDCGDNHLQLFQDYLNDSETDE